MKVREGAGLVFGLLACVACSSDGGNADDGGVAVDFEPIIGGTLANSYPEAAYLNIDLSTAGGYACSGTLIAPRVVLTAGHCVDGHTNFEVYAGGAYRQSTSSAVYDWNENGVETVNHAHHDIGLVFLSEPVTLTTYPTLTKTKLPDKTKVTNVGRVLNGVVRSGVYQASTLVTAGDSVGYPFDYQSPDIIQPGDSGGPVFKYGSHTLVAVNSGAGSGLQVLARVDLLYDWITAQVAAHTPSAAFGSAGATNSAGASGAAAGAGAGGASSTNAGSAGMGGVAAVAGGGGSGSSASVACSVEKESNNDLNHANALVGSACGSIASKTDVDWYSIKAGVGSHALRIAPGSDATFAVGLPSRTTCVLSAQGASRVNVNVSGGDVNLCVKVSSAGKKTQSYTLSFD